MARTTLSPVHSGEVLPEEFLEPMQIRPYRLAEDITVLPRRINDPTRTRGPAVLARVARLIYVPLYWYLRCFGTIIADGKRWRRGSRICRSGPGER